jgi:outer membrane usher protein
METQRSLPAGEGYGYQLRGQSGAVNSFNGAGRYQGRYGRYEVRRDVIGGRGVTSASMAGAIVAIGGNVFASRPVQDSFALVQVPGVSGVRGFASNQEVGRTDRSGNLLIPDLQPYYGNLLQVADSDIPLEYSVSSTTLTMALPYRGGARAVFPVQQLRRITGTVQIVQGGEARIPGFGQVVVVIRGEEHNSPVGSTGTFYFEDLAPGRYPARVEDGAGECGFVLQVPAAAKPIVELGTVTCVVAQTK